MQNFVKKNPDRPDIDLVGLFLVQVNFGSHVFLSSAVSVGNFLIFHTCAEIREFWLPVVSQQNVLRLDVSVDNSLTVQILNTLQDLVVDLQLTLKSFLL